MQQKDSKHFIKDIELLANIVDFLEEKTGHGNDYFIIASATSVLGKFLNKDNNNSHYNKDQDSYNEYCKRAMKINQQVFDRLVRLLYDERRKIKINACKSLSDTDSPSTFEPRLMHSIKFLIDVAEHDLDGFVRSQAERSLNIIRDWIKDLANNPPKIDIKLREKRSI